MNDQLEIIHESHVNGKLRQMAEQIEEYGIYQFTLDYPQYLIDLYTDTEAAFQYLAHAWRAVARKAGR